MCFTYNNDAVNAQTIIKQGDLIENEGWTDYMMKSNWPLITVAFPPRYISQNIFQKALLYAHKSGALTRQLTPSGSAQNQAVCR